MEQPQGIDEPSGVCPACGLLIRPESAVVSNGYWAISGDHWGISHTCACPNCKVELIASPGNRLRWEQQEPASIVWHRFIDG